MSETGLTAFDKALQVTHLWLNEIGEAVGPDTQRQYHALRAVLFALRDRLTVDEAFNLSAQLPMLVRGIFWESYSPAGKPEPVQSAEGFLGKISENLGQIEPLNAEACARAVLGVLARHVAEGEVEEIRHILPEPIRAFFPNG